MHNQTTRLKTLVFMAFCCVLSLFSKRIISPATNFLTDLLRLPGGSVAAGLGFCFLLIAASVSGWRWAGTAMGLTQGLLALALGMAGNQGLLAPVTYSVPGFMMDMIRLCFRKKPCSAPSFLTAGTAAAGANAVCSSLLVFHFRGIPLLLWLVSSACAGLVGGMLAWLVFKKFPTLGGPHGTTK